MIITENLTDNQMKKISEHFYLYEFASTSPNPYRVTKTYSNTVKYSIELLKNIEAIIGIMGADKAFISSGYRTPQHDKEVGGDGNGQHTKGTAVDICFFKGDTPIDNRIVSIIAQDIGFRGIARIGYNGYIHLDMRTNGMYLGDETKNYNTVTSDFRKYYNINNKQISQAIGKTYPIPTTLYEGLDYEPVFDYLFYYYKYLDLQKAFGKNKAALFNHFVTYGMKEGRQASKDFDVNVYRNNYADLQKAFSDDLTAYYKHYIMYGKSEGRIADKPM